MLIAAMQRSVFSLTREGIGGGTVFYHISCKSQLAPSNCIIYHVDCPFIPYLMHMQAGAVRRALPVEHAGNPAAGTQARNAGNPIKGGAVKFFLDTADLNEIEEAASWGALAGVTTNPTLYARIGGKLDDFHNHIKRICDIVDGPVSAESVAMTRDEIVRDGRELAAIAPNVVVKVPTMVEGLAATRQLADEGNTRPVVARVRYDDDDLEWLQVKAGADLGPVVMSGLVDGIWIDAPHYARQDEVVSIAFGILQSARVRMSKTEFISCPSCGRTMFDLQTTVKRVQQATAHLTHLKIGVMGCVVNGPGEMADADYGYVGAARGRISLYKGKECIEKNIPEEEAIDRLVNLIKAAGDWKEP